MTTGIPLLNNRYKILRLIRQGGMGTTYQGLDVEQNRTVVIKELTDEFKTQDERELGITNFLAEMGVLKKIHHPQIPRILDHFVEKRGFFFVLEFIDGEDFALKLEHTHREPLFEEDVVRLGIHVCRVLEYLHNLPVPIIHRDIKPSNLMQRFSDQRIMLVDFGISRAAHPGQGLMIGTLGYSPPEQYHHQADPRSDVFSLGATLHELATGIRPSEESFSFPPPISLREGFHPGFSEIILQAVNYYPENRFSTARAFEEALQSLLVEPVPPLQVNPFEEATQKFSQVTLFPLLSKIQEQYKNECQTKVLPATLDRLDFVLQSHISYALIIQVNEVEQSVHFSLKEGLLSPKSLGQVYPLQPNTWERADEMVKRFLALFEASLG